MTQQIPVSQKTINVQLRCNVKHSTLDDKAHFRPVNNKQDIVQKMENDLN